MIEFKIEAGYSETSTGRVIKVWHVTDAKSGYIFDTFNLKRDAKAYVERSEALQQKKG